jgi:hypothetical protein
MEKVIVLLRDAERDDRWCSRLRGSVADKVLALGVPGLTVNVRDDAVRTSLMTLTTLEPPVVGIVSIWFSGATATKPGRRSNCFPPSAEASQRISSPSRRHWCRRPLN